MGCDKDFKQADVDAVLDARSAPVKLHVPLMGEFPLVPAFQHFQRFSERFL